jgi:hypothetical protein
MAPIRPLSAHLPAASSVEARIYEVSENYGAPPGHAELSAPKCSLCGSSKQQEELEAGGRNAG